MGEMGDPSPASNRYSNPAVSRPQFQTFLDLPLSVGGRILAPQESSSILVAPVK